MSFLFRAPLLLHTEVYLANPLCAVAEEVLVAAQRHKRDDDDVADPDADDGERGLSIGEVLRSTDAGVRKSLWTLVAIMLFQQLSSVPFSIPLLSVISP